MIWVKSRSLRDRRCLVLRRNRVEGATTVGARFGSLCDDAEGTKRASHASLVSSNTVRAPSSSLTSIAECM